MEILIDLTPMIDELTKKSYIPVPYLVAKGYKKSVVDAAFTELEVFEFGVFNRGKRGRANVGIFYPNDTCPLYYTYKRAQKVSKKDLFEF